MTFIELDQNGFPKGSGIFETIKTINGAPIALSRHMRRAVESALELGISLPNEDFIRDQIVAIVKANPHTVGRLRICFGENIFHISHQQYLEKDIPARLNFYSQTVAGSAHKKFPYDDRFALLQIAKDEGFDDCILFNGKNEITESAVSNLAMWISDEWVTPPISAGILPGVIRAIAIEECGVRVRPIHVSEIPNVQSAFLLSSLRIAQPISHIGEMKLHIGEASQLLEDQIRAACQPLSVG